MRRMLDRMVNCIYCAHLVLGFDRVLPCIWINIKPRKITGRYINSESMILREYIACWGEGYGYEVSLLRGQ